MLGGLVLGGGSPKWFGRVHGLLGSNPIRACGIGLLEGEAKHLARRNHCVRRPDPLDQCRMPFSGVLIQISCGKLSFDPIAQVQIVRWIDDCTDTYLSGPIGGRLW